ncbi:hypothetical protein E0Z10_g5963 [Xylaria hypoxylon]|uniref:Uncharacterized protein n=1 Tax=Xylaria hypoxylon TaxID=37992 RepID=A0A4Z0YES2_9PEZI|nr:hypothetical protein E0Z10_g5963 [Xylaria hypoxylon]
MQLSIFMGLLNALTFLQLGDDLANSHNRIFFIFICIITEPVLTLQISHVLFSFATSFSPDQRADYGFIMYELYYIFVASIAHPIASMSLPSTALRRSRALCGSSSTRSTAPSPAADWALVLQRVAPLPLHRGILVLTPCMV